MDLRQVERFIAAADQGHFGKAAAQLNLTSAALSRSIELLEDELGASLFERGPQGVILTVFGAAMAPHARVMLHERRRASNAIAQIQGLASGEVSIGFTPPFANWILPEAILALKQKHPILTTHAVEDALPALLPKLRDGELDLVFGTPTADTRRAGLKFAPLLESRVMVVAHAAHPLAGLGGLSFADLARYDWVISDSPYVLTLWRTLFVKSGVEPPRSAVRTSSHAFLKACVVKAGCVAMMDDASLSEDIRAGAVARLDVGVDAAIGQAGVFIRDGAAPAPAAAALAEALASACARAGRGESTQRA